MVRTTFRLVAAFALGTLSLTALTPTASAQDDGCFYDAATTYSLYYEDFKNGNYDFALPWLKCQLKIGALYPQNDDRNFRRAMQVYDTLAARATNPATRTAYRDTVLVLMNQRDEALAAANQPLNEFDAALQRATYLFRFKNDLPASYQDQILPLYERAYELQPDSLDDYYLTALLQAYATDKAKAVAFIEATEPLLDTDEAKAYYTQIKNEVLFRTPAERYTFLLDQYNKGQTDNELVAELFDLADRQGDLQTMQLLKEQILTMEPTVDTIRKLGQMAARENNYDEAMSLYERAIAMTDDESVKRDLYYNMANMRYSQGQHGEARRLARQALAIDANHGPSNYLIGSLIHLGVSGSSLESRYALWLAADYYERAMRDGAIADQARQALARARAGFPTREELFFKNLQPGATVTVQGETTRVR